jgi:tRNA pseudouridine38-40 synthase
MDATESDILKFLNTKGEIPPEAEVSKREGAAKAKKAGEESGEQDAVESDDEEVDQAMLKRGELEG